MYSEYSNMAAHVSPWVIPAHCTVSTSWLLMEINGGPDAEDPLPSAVLVIYRPFLRTVAVDPFRGGRVSMPI